MDFVSISWAKQEDLKWTERWTVSLEHNRTEKAQLKPSIIKVKNNILYLWYFVTIYLDTPSGNNILDSTPHLAG